MVHLVALAQHRFCCSAVFTGTKRIDGRRTASQIASASRQMSNESAASLIQSVTFAPRPRRLNRRATIVSLIRCGTTAFAQHAVAIVHRRAAARLRRARAIMRMASPMLLLGSVKLNQSRFDHVGLAFSVTVALFVKAFRIL
jgi:hypothetical protein